MTHTSLISEHITFAVISGKFSGTPKESRLALMNFLRIHDRFFPKSVLVEDLDVNWRLDEASWCVEAEYVNTRAKRKASVVGVLGRESAAAAATIISTAGAEHAPVLHGDISHVALRTYAEMLNPVHFTIERYFDSVANVKLSESDTLTPEEGPTSTGYNPAVRRPTRTVLEDIRNGATPDWTDSQLDSFPKEKPKERDSLEFFQWAFYASRKPELHPELEKEFSDLPKGLRILLLRQPNGEAQRLMNLMLMRSHDRLAARKAE